jgi:hypothetical protein
VEVERGGTRVSEGDPENWAAVAMAINDRVRELGWRQRDLAERSNVSAGWNPEHRDRVCMGHAQQSGHHAAPDRAVRYHCGD